MRRARTSLTSSVALLALACDAPGASIQIADARALRTPDRRVLVDVDLLGSEGLGGNVGNYCVRVTFAGEPATPEECRSDLADGDTRTVRLMSAGDVAPGAAIAIRVRLDRLEVGRSIVAPPR